MKKKDFITTAQAAEKLGVGQRRVLQFLKSERIKGEQFGRQWMVRESSLESVKARRPGRPKRGSK